MTAKILIVDDERLLAENIAYNLKKEGFETLVAYDGESALMQTRDAGPNLVVLDLMLPKISGWQVCSALRRDWAYRFDGFILMLTARVKNPTRHSHRARRRL
jgi:DNA-binding response OmpR family regulator